MINWFLRAKHWQLFILTFGVMMAGYITIMYLFFTDMMTIAGSGQQPDPMVMFRYMKFLPVLVVFVMLVTMGWYWSVGIGFQDKLPAGVTIKTNLFKIFLIVPAVYLVVFLVLMGVFVNQMFEITANNETPDSLRFPSIMAFPFIIMPLHFFSLFCYFYNMYFVAKVIKTVELQRATTFGDFVGEFFLIWFFPIGVWILQPRINSLHENGPGIRHNTDPTVLDETIRK